MDWKQWVNLIGAILGILAALFTIPPIIYRALRRYANEYDSRTRKTATKRLAQMEKELETWREAPAIEKHQAIFYSAALVSISFIAFSLDVAALYVYVGWHNPPSKLMALAIVMLSITAVLAFTSGNYFTKYLPWVRASRIRETEEQISKVRLILMKLSLKDAPLIEVRSPVSESTPKLP